MGRIPERFTERVGIFQKTKVHNVVCVDKGKGVRVCVYCDGSVMCVRHANCPKSSKYNRTIVALIDRTIGDSRLPALMV